jgi:hypothetical protein
MDRTKDSRYPYTYADDYIRQFGGYDRSGVRLSRADASQIIQAVATAIGEDKEALAKKVADYALANEVRLADEASDKFMRAIGY